jgi:hypothetical protein
MNPLSTSINDLVTETKIDHNKAILYARIFARDAVDLTGDTKILPGDVLSIITADFLTSSLGMDQDRCITLILGSLYMLHTIGHTLRTFGDDFCARPVAARGELDFPVAVLELIDNSVVQVVMHHGIVKPMPCITDLTTGSRPGVLPTCPPVLSVAINLTALWIKSVSRLFGHDSLRADFLAGKVRRQTAA